MWSQASLTYTPKEKELIDKLQQLDKISKESKAAKDKSHEQKSELATKMKELMAQNEELKGSVKTIKTEKTELEGLVEFMKNAGYNQE